MGFGNHGFFVTKPDEPLEQKEIIQILSLYLNEWIEKFNFKKYKQTLDTELENVSQIETTLLESGDKKDVFNVKLKKRNDYVVHELKCIEAKINSIKNLLTAEGWNVTRNIDHSIRTYEMNDVNFNSGANISFLKKLRKNYRYKFNSYDELITRIKGIDKECALYYFSLIYVDYCKTQKFLLKLYDPELVEKTTIEKEGKSNYTAIQWMLYHYILQEAKIKPPFPMGGKVGAFMKLSVEYNVKPQNLRSQYNKILSKNSYSEKDAKKAKELIEKNHPEALEKFKDITKHILF